MAGTGKPMIVHTITRAYFEQGRLAARFFLSKVAEMSATLASFSVRITSRYSWGEVGLLVRNYVRSVEEHGEYKHEDEWDGHFYSTYLKMSKLYAYGLHLPRE